MGAEHTKVDNYEQLQIGRSEIRKKNIYYHLKVRIFYQLVEDFCTFYLNNLQHFISKEFIMLSLGYKIIHFSTIDPQ